MNEQLYNYILKSFENNNFFKFKFDNIEFVFSSQFAYSNQFLLVRIKKHSKIESFKIKNALFEELNVYENIILYEFLKSINLNTSLFVYDRYIKECDWKSKKDLIKFTKFIEQLINTLSLKVFI